MKKALIPLIFLLFFSDIFGQGGKPVKNIAAFGLNAGFYGSGDVYMPAPYIEYTRIIRPWIGLTPRLMWAHTSRQSDRGFTINTSFDASISLSLTPLPGKLHRLKVQLGGLYHKFEHSGGYYLKSKPAVFQGEDINYFKESGFGLTGSLIYNIIDNPKMASGLRLDMLTAFHDRIFNIESTQMGMFFGIKF